MEPTIGPAIQAWLGGVAARLYMSDIKCENARWVYKSYIPTDGLEATFWGVREVWVAKVEVLLGIVTLDVFLLVVAVFDDDAVVDAALFVGRTYTMVVIWPSVDVYVSVEYESRWQRFRYGSKGEISIVPPLGSEPCSLMQTLQALRTFVKSEPAAHNWLFNPSAEAIAKASSNDGILALNPVESRTRSLDKCFTTYCRDQSTQRVQSRHYLTVQRGFWTKPLMLYGSSICV